MRSILVLSRSTLESSLIFSHRTDLESNAKHEGVTNLCSSGNFRPIGDKNSQLDLGLDFLNLAMLSLRLRLRSKCPARLSKRGLKLLSVGAAWHFCLGLETIELRFSFTKSKSS